MKKWVLSALLVLCMLFTLLPTAVWAVDDATTAWLTSHSGTLVVGNVTVTVDNADNILGDNTASFAVENGVPVLTLNGAAITEGCRKNVGDWGTMGIYSHGNLTIRLAEGTANTVNVVGESGSRGILAYQGSLTITGKGTLTASAHMADGTAWCKGIEANGAYLTIGGGAAVTAIGDVGAYAPASLAVKDGATLTLSGTRYAAEAGGFDLSEDYAVLGGESADALQVARTDKMPHSDYYIFVGEGNTEDDLAKYAVIVEHLITQQPARDNSYTVIAPDASGYQWYTTKEVGKTVVSEDATGDDETVPAAWDRGDYDETTRQWTVWNNQYFSIDLAAEDKLTVSFPDGMPTSGTLLLVPELAENEAGALSYTLGSPSSDGFAVTGDAVTFTIPESGEYMLKIRDLSVDAADPAIQATQTRLGPDKAVDGQTTATLTAAEAGTYLCQVTWADGFRRNSNVVTIPHVHPVCGAECGHDPAHADVEWTAWSDATSLPTDAGNYYLTTDVTLPNKSWAVPTGTVDLCLNGHTVMRNGGNSVAIYIPGGAALNICDCAGGGVLAHNSSQAVIRVGGEAHLYSGVITGKGYDQSYGSEYGVEVLSGGTFQMHGGSITGVITNSGTGVYMERNGAFLMDGGAITGNKMGVLCVSSGAFRAEGDVVIAGNDKLDDTLWNVVLNGGLMELSGPLGENAQLGLGLYRWSDMNDQDPYLAVQGTDSYAVTAADLKKLSCDSVDYTLKLDEGKVYITEPPAHSHAVSTDCSTTEGTQVSFKALTGDANGKLYTDGTELSKDGNFYVLPAGSYYLSGDITTTQRVKTSGVANLCFNGCTITYDGGSDDGAFITVPSGSTLNTCDCQEGGGITDTRSVTGGQEMRILKVEGEAALYGGAFDCTATDGHGGVEVIYAGKLTVDGANITSKSGAVYLWAEGQLTLKSGTLEAKQPYGGAVVTHSTKFTMEGGTITTGTYYTGVYFAKSRAGGGANSGDGGGTIRGGTIKAGTGIQVEGSETVTLSGAPVINARTGIYFYTNAGGLLQVNDLTGKFSVEYYSTVNENSPYTFTAPADADQSGHFTSADSSLGIRDVEDQTTHKHTVQLYKPASHTHTWATAWNSNASGHWHACTATGCTITDYANCGETGAAYGAHVYTDDKDTTCNTCGYTRTVALSGTVSITGTVKIGQTLTANVTGAPSGVTLAYAWTVQGGDGTVLAATAAYTPNSAELVGKTLVCTVTTSDTHYTGALTATTSGSVALGDQPAPSRELFTVTDVPVNGTTGAIAVSGDAGKLEYRPVTDPATETWTAAASSNTLPAGTYEFRYKETDTHSASPATAVQVRALTANAKTLTIATDIPHGSVTAVRPTVNPGDTVTLTVQPDDGYELETLTVHYTEDGADKTITPTVKADNAAQYTFQMPNADVTVTAAFAAVTPPAGDVTGEVEVKGDAPTVAVDEETLKDLAGEVSCGDTVTVKLTVEKQETPVDKADIEAVVTGDKENVLYLDLSLIKQINDDAPEAITDTQGKVLEIAVDYDFSGKRDVTVYRKHGGNAAEKMTALAARPTRDLADGSFYADSANGVVYIYASKFSTYAIGYTAETTSPINPSRPSGSSTTYYTITATAGQGGAISPSGKMRIRRKGTKAFTITPDEGYAVADVLVDGKSVGAVTEYVFEKATANHTIEVSFKEADTRPMWNPFEDVKAESWFHDSVKYTYEQGLMAGTDETHFSPDEDTSRAMIVTILYRMAGSPETDATLTYPDCQADTWYSQAVAWATETGVVKGYDTGDFGPEDPITREQLAVMLYHYAKAEKANGDLTGFVDAESVSGWAEDAVTWAVENGIIHGKGGGILDPKGQATRAEAAAMLEGFCQRET